MDQAEVDKSKVSEKLLDAQHEILHLKSSLEVRIQYGHSVYHTVSLHELHLTRVPSRLHAMFQTLRLNSKLGLLPKERASTLSICVYSSLLLAALGLVHVVPDNTVEVHAYLGMCLRKRAEGETLSVADLGVKSQARQQRQRDSSEASVRAARAIRCSRQQCTAVQPGHLGH